MSQGHVLRCWWGIIPKGYGPFYITRYIWHEDAHYEDELEFEYLHSDGKWRKGIQNESNEYTGWHPSREAAEAILTKSQIQGAWHDQRCRRNGNLDRW